jgi:hypothetical protein
MGNRATEFFRISMIAAVILMVLATHATWAQSDDVISIERDESVTWIEASITFENADKVTVRVKALTADRSGTWLYQRCSFPYSGPGTYHCGIDTDSAPQHPGRWKAIVDVDGARLAQRWFEVDK